MYKLIRKLALSVSLLLILSQWLSLAHATEHLISIDDAQCQVCSLQHHFHSISLAAKSCTPVITESEIPDTAVYSLYRHTSLANKPIRAPPQ